LEDLPPSFRRAASRVLNFLIRIGARIFRGLVKVAVRDPPNNRHRRATNGNGPLRVIKSRSRANRAGEARVVQRVEQGRDGSRPKGEQTVCRRIFDGLPVLPRHREDIDSPELAPVLIAQTENPFLCLLRGRELRDLLVVEPDVRMVLDNHFPQDGCRILYLRDVRAMREVLFNAPQPFE